MFDKLFESWHESRAVAEREDAGFLAHVALAAVYRLEYDSLNGRFDYQMARDIVEVIPKSEIINRELGPKDIPEQNESD